MLVASLLHSTTAGIPYEELPKNRLKNGRCSGCGTLCFQKTMMTIIPITKRGKVLEGRCLSCYPLKNKNDHQTFC